ncbi:Glucose/arabinose dehydrogenase, beta-propeller fold [Bradyrhizobium sp. NFR13]|jgi:glucose/arabinose dehydrogenase|uniref:PQQ-dependent sugar dehydrogenase n=1 Tax=Bradyrhizobium sp. NFR13 TaxID=1566285 RepID=UPI0008EA5815|nr:PQQ-dependent sugar dehydrogenase [Bradyrhizobium sp. NFR13]SFM17879.1 Glucose/arabinose dehydrogenase, beta-propeller fold [Bradyrhizobium sp. NFR13]
MSVYTSARRALLAGAFIGVFASGAFAQQSDTSPATPAPAVTPSAAPAAPAAAPAPAPAAPQAAAPAPAAPAVAAAPALPPGSPLIGRPDGAAAAKLAPVAPPPIPSAADKLPTAKLKLPPGFNIEVYAAGMANARSMREGDKGTVFVGSRLVDKVYAVINNDGKRQVKVLASGLYRPNGLAFKDGTLYIAELSKISKIEKVEDNLENPPKPVMIYDNLPKDEAHGWKFIGIGPDNKLYVPIGQPGNNVLHDEAHGQIRRMNLDGTGAEIYVKGVRNTVGFDWNPTTKQMYFTDNGRDWVSEAVPEDELNRVTKAGEDFGAPYCLQGNILDPEFGWGKSCADYTAPVGLLGAHTAALGMRFYTGKMFPAAYKDAIFIARHGSWNKTQKLGGDVVVAKLNKDGTVKSVEPFLTGFIEDNKYVGRPVDVLQMKDGSLLVSDDWNGAIYRITYGKQKVAGAK